MIDTPLLSFALSQFLGLYLLIITVILFSRLAAFRQMAMRLDPDSGVLVLAGMTGLAVGMILVGVHNIWVFSPIVVITVLSWIILLFSVFLLAAPDKMVNLIKSMFFGSTIYWTGAVMGLLGLLILIRGVYLYATHHHQFIFQ